MHLGHDAANIDTVPGASNRYKPERVSASCPVRQISFLIAFSPAFQPYPSGLRQQFQRTGLRDFKGAAVPGDKAALAQLAQHPGKCLRRNA